MDQLTTEIDGISVEKTVDRIQYNFMGWDKRIMPLFPLGHGSEFPALFAWRAGVNNQLQNLTKENHDIQLYPYWTNASDYIDTDKSFDTIALHNANLHEKLVKKSKKLGRVKLTREQQHISNAMGTPLPLLPMAHKDKYEAYAKYILGHKEVGDFDKAAEDWLEYVDGVNIMPKLPSHLRTYDETFTRNLRIKDCMKRAGDGTKKLKELNAEVSPTNMSDDGAVSSWKEPAMPLPMPEPAATAMHTAPFRIIGGTLVGLAIFSTSVKSTFFLAVPIYYSYPL
jgi:hypothetical protein